MGTPGWMRTLLRELWAHLGVLSAGVIFFMEGFGAPFPVEVPLYIIGTRVERGLNTYWQMVLMMWGFTVAGNSVGYAIGYYGGRPLVNKLASWFHVKPETMEKIESFFRRYGLWMTLVTRWINWGFAQNMWLCGITRVPMRLFIPIMAVNDFFWAMAWTWVAWKFAGRLHAFWRRVDAAIPYGARVAIVVALVVGVALLVWWLSRRRQERD